MTGVRFLFRVTLRRHDLAAEVWHIKEPEKLPPVLSPEEVKRVLTMATNLQFAIRAPTFRYAVRRSPRNCTVRLLA
jgi:site-specific recombinase XerD